MKINHPFIYGIAFLSTLSACQQDPFESSLKPGQRIIQNNPSHQNQKPKVFSIEAPDLIECTESMSCGAEILGHVPEPGIAQIRIKGLPAGAEYDPVTHAFTYTPGFEVVDLVNHPDQTMVLMPLTLTVRSSEDSVSETSRTINLLVKNKLQPVELNVIGSATVDEGATLEQVVEVKSADFPNGPIALTALNAPTGTEVKAVPGSNQQFKVRFTPGFSFAGVRDSFSNSVYYKRAKVTFQASLPVGQPVQKEVQWTVNDVRQMPAVSAPETLVQGLDVNFSIRAEDLNGEVAPKITVNASVPFGRLTTTTIAESQGQSVAYPSRVVQVHWDQLRLSNLNTTTPIQYEVCVQRTYNGYVHCTNKTVSVTLKSELHLAPKIDRAAWKSGDLKFLRMGDAWSLALPILDVEDRGLPVNVKLESNQPGAVTWNKGSLNIAPQMEGILQFSVTAESAFGIRATENFVLEILPQSWSKALLLTADSAQKESLDTAKLLPSADLLSMRFQVSSRTLALRDTAWISTEALSSSLLDTKMQDLVAKHAATVLIASPLANQLTGKIAEKMTKFGIQFKGRMKDIVPSAEVWMMSLNVDPRSRLESPQAPAGLKGTLTVESFNPLVLDTDRLSAKCSVLFKLQKPGVSMPLGVKCENNNESLIVLGFEMADVALAAGDEGIMKSWIQELTGLEGVQ